MLTHLSSQLVIFPLSKQLFLECFIHAANNMSKLAPMNTTHRPQNPFPASGVFFNYIVNHESQ